MDMGPGQVLIEYDPDASLFAQLETARQEEEVYKNAPATAKTAMTLQKIIDRSMVRLTLEEQRINDLANDLAKPETVDMMKHKVVNSLAGFGRVKFMTKKDEKSEEKMQHLLPWKTKGNRLWMTIQRQMRVSEVKCLFQALRIESSK